MTALLVLFAITLAATVIGTLLALEAQAWAPHVSRRLLRRAIVQFPGDLPEARRSRWVEEIEADLARYGDRPFGGLVFAFRLWRRGGRELAAELALRDVLETMAPARPGGGG